MESTNKYWCNIPVKMYTADLTRERIRYEESHYPLTAAV